MPPSFRIATAGVERSRATAHTVRQGHRLLARHRQSPPSHVAGLPGARQTGRWRHRCRAVRRQSRHAQKQPCDPDWELPAGQSRAIQRVRWFRPAPRLQAGLPVEYQKGSDHGNEQAVSQPDSAVWRHEEWSGWENPRVADRWMRGRCLPYWEYWSRSPPGRLARTARYETLCLGRPPDWGVEKLGLTEFSGRCGRSHFCCALFCVAGCVRAAPLGLVWWWARPVHPGFRDVRTSLHPGLASDRAFGTEAWCGHRVSPAGTALNQPRVEGRKARNPGFAVTTHGSKPWKGDPNWLPSASQHVDANRADAARKPGRIHRGTMPCQPQVFNTPVLDHSPEPSALRQRSRYSLCFSDALGNVAPACHADRASAERFSASRDLPRQYCASASSGLLDRPTPKFFG